MKSFDRYLGKKAEGGTLQEIFENYGLNFQVQKQPAINPLKFQAQLELADDRNYSAAEIKSAIKAAQSEEFCGMYRQDNLQQLGQVGAGYMPMQHQELFGLLEQFAQQHEDAYWNVPFCWDGGALVGASLVIPSLGFNVKGVDRHFTRLRFVKGHAGNALIKILFETVREVCINGAVMLVENGGLRLKHTLKMPSKVSNWSRLLDQTPAAFNTIQQNFELLADKQASTEFFKKFTKEMYGETGTNKNGQPRTHELLESFTNLFEVNDSNTFPEQRGTLFNVFNAVTAQVSHMLTNNLTPKYNEQSRVLGAGFAKVNKALSLLLDETKHAKDHKPAQSTSYSLPAYTGAQYGDFADDAPLVMGTILN